MDRKKSLFIQAALLIGTLIILAGCISRTPDGYLKLQSLGPAPELENQVWINIEHPLRLADLRGSVVLLEMWTYG